jgi:hypothetical protein
MKKPPRPRRDRPNASAPSNSPSRR